MTKKNVVGEKYNMLTIVSDAPSKREPSGRLLKMVNAVCDCGREKQNVSYKALKRGNNKSCGCLSEKQKVRVDIGDKFGHWTTLEENPYDKKKDGRNFTCQCVCGKVRTVSSYALRKGESKSCGCKGVPPKEKIIKEKRVKQIIVKEKIIPQDTEEEQWKECISVPNYYISTLGRLWSHLSQKMIKYKKVYRIKNKTFVAKNEVYRTFIGDIPKGYILIDNFTLLETSTERVKKLISVYSGMKSRCTNKNNKDYSHYGGRGIIVEDSFSTARKFIEWSLSNGFDFGKGLSIDREDTNGNYSSDNCQWIPIGENCQKTRKAKLNKDIAFEIREGIYKDTSANELSSLFNCINETIWNARRGATWK